MQVKQNSQLFHSLVFFNFCRQVFDFNGKIGHLNVHEVNISTLSINKVAQIDYVGPKDDANDYVTQNYNVAKFSARNLIAVEGRYFTHVTLNTHIICI